GERPVSASSITTPRLYTSLAASTSSPHACSGEAYAAVPITILGMLSNIPVLVSGIAAGIIVVGGVATAEASVRPILASPKSRTLAWPGEGSIMFWGLIPG